MKQADHTPSLDKDHVPGSALLVGMGLYTVWGLSPVYLKQLSSVSPYEVVLHRALWSLLFFLLICSFVGRLGAVARALPNRKAIAMLIPSALLISANWLLNVVATVENHILAISLGYFLTPLVNVGLGVLVLQERVSRALILAVCLGFCGVVLMGAAALQTMWLSLGLALFFGVYGLIHKMAPVGAVVGLTIETTLLAPFAIAWLIWMHGQGTMAFGTDLRTSVLLIGSGVVLTIPLLLFGVVVRRLPLVIIGLLQYIAPSVQFLIALWLYHEPFNLTKFASFLLIWFGLAIFSVDTFRKAQRTRNLPV